MSETRRGRPPKKKRRAEPYEAPRYAMDLAQRRTSGILEETMRLASIDPRELNLVTLVQSAYLQGVHDTFTAISPTEEDDT